MQRKTRIWTAVGMVGALLLMSAVVLSCAQPTGDTAEPLRYSTPDSAKVLAISEPTDTSLPTASPMAFPTERPSTTPSHTTPRTQTAALPMIYLPCLRKAPSTPTPVPSPTPTPPTTLPVHPEVPALVLANYIPWYDPSTWDTGCTSGDDRPRDGIYNSDDPEVISRHIDQARSAELSGFVVHWFAPDDRTNSNLRKVLDQSPEGFNSTVTFLHHILPGVKQQGVVDALHYVQGTYSGHPRFLRVGEKPVIFFSDMYRVPDMAGKRPASDQDVAKAVARWAEIRNVLDPGHTTWWIAEGLRPEYLEVFDGLFVYKIDHACCPNSYQKAPRWANSVRLWEQQTGRAKLWVGTVMPGWDDLNSAQAHCVDLRVSSEQFARDRDDGAYYARTWEAVLPTAPDMVLIHSFNEWVEGSYIEPSNGFGSLYIPLTAQWVTLFRASR